MGPDFSQEFGTSAAAEDFIFTRRRRREFAVNYIHIYNTVYKVSDRVPAESSITTHSMGDPVYLNICLLFLSRDFVCVQTNLPSSSTTTSVIGHSSVVGHRSIDQSIDQSIKSTSDDESRRVTTSGDDDGE